MQFFVRLFVCNTATTRLAEATQPAVHMNALVLFSRRQDSTRQGQGLGSEQAACNPGSTSGWPAPWALFPNLYSGGCGLPGGWRVRVNESGREKTWKSLHPQALLCFSHEETEAVPNTVLVIEIQDTHPSGASIQPSAQNSYSVSRYVAQV